MDAHAQDASPPIAPTLVRELLVAEASVKARRLIALGLWEHGMDLDSPLLGERLGLELERGVALVSRLRSRLPPAEVACFFGERAFGLHRPTMMAKLPYLLAHGHHMVDLLARLAAPDVEPKADRCFSGAAFNLACVLLDHITDRMRSMPEIERSLPAEDVGRLLLDDDGPCRLDRLIRRDPLDELSLFGRVLALFAGPLRQARPARSRLEELAHLLVRGYAAQLTAARHGDRATADDMRVKSITPHLLLGHIAALTCPDEARGHVLRLAQRTGEVFGLLDDIVDVADDAVDGQANAVTARARAGAGTADELMLLTLDGPALPGAARDLLELILDLVGQTRRWDGHPAATEWLQFVFAYIARTYR